MEMKTDTILDTRRANGTFSIKKQNYTMIDSKKVYTAMPERRSFVPGQFEELKEYAPQFLDMANTVWTPDVIESYKKQRQELPEYP